jgi:hypothetical protein
MLEEAAWFLAWVVILYGVHYQFKICIPATLFVLKLLESFFLLFMVKLFVFYQIHGDGMDFKAATWELYNYTKEQLKTFEL